MGILFTLVCLAIVLPIALAIGAVILRAAVSISNKIIGPQPTSRYDDDYDDDYDDEDDDDDDDDDDDRPRRRKKKKSRRSGSQAIPEPGMGKGMGIVFVAWLVNTGVGLVIGLAIGGGLAAAGGAGAGKAGIDNAAIIANLASLPVSFLVLAGICTAMLPTTFGRGCLVALFYWLISLLIAAIIVGVLFAVGFAMFQGGR